MQCLWEHMKAAITFTMYKCFKNVRKKETAQRDHYHTSERTHVPRNPCWVIIWSRFGEGTIWEGGGVWGCGCERGATLLEAGLVHLDFTWGGLSVHLEQSSANIARTHAMVSTQSFIGRKHHLIFILSTFYGCNCPYFIFTTKSRFWFSLRF